MYFILYADLLYCEKSRGLNQDLWKPVVKYLKLLTVRRGLGVAQWIGYMLQTTEVCICYCANKQY